MFYVDRAENYLADMTGWKLEEIIQLVDGCGTFEEKMQVIFNAMKFDLQEQFREIRACMIAKAEDLEMSEKFIETMLRELEEVKTFLYLTYKDAKSIFA